MIPDLAERFQAPAGWRTGNFTNPENGHYIHYGYAFPVANPVRAIVVCLGGLSEFSEKYFELAHDMLDRGYAFFFMDWHYQGRSARHPLYPQRRHSDGFDKDVSDLNFMIEKIVIPLSPEKDSLPIVMIAHSMGAHIGLRYLAEQNGPVKAAAFSAPFFGIYDFGKHFLVIAWLIGKMQFLIGTRYVFSGRDWQEHARKGDGSQKFSSHPLRDAIHNAWSKSDEALRVGHVTFGWLIEALKSCRILAKPETGKAIKIPVLIALAGKDIIVDNAATRTSAAYIPDVKLIDVPCANHEILMETDECRNIFLSAFDTMMGKIARN